VEESVTFEISYKTFSSKLRQFVILIRGTGHYNHNGMY